MTLRNVRWLFASHVSLLLTSYLLSAILHTYHEWNTGFLGLVGEIPRIIVLFYAGLGVLMATLYPLITGHAIRGALLVTVVHRKPIL